MTKRRFIYNPETKEMEEVPLHYVAPQRDYQSLLWNDRHYDNTRATDGTDISTRKKHAAYMKANGLAMTSDFKQAWKDSQQRQRDYLAGKDPSRREDIARAMHKLETRRER